MSLKIITFERKLTMSPTDRFPRVPGTASVSCLLTWLGTKGDYSGLEKKGSAVQGTRRYFCSYTKEGKIVTVLGTYMLTGVVLYYLWNNRRSSKTKTEV